MGEEGTDKDIEGMVSQLLHKTRSPKLLGVFKNLVESRVLKGYKTQDQDVTLNPILQTSEEQ